METRWRTADVRALLERCPSVRAVTRVRPEEEEGDGEAVARAIMGGEDLVDLLVVRPEGHRGARLFVFVMPPDGGESWEPGDSGPRAVCVVPFAAADGPGRRCFLAVRRALLEAGFAVCVRDVDEPEPGEDGDR